MASQPPQLPESIILSHFKGVRNTVNRERLSPEDFESATNVDIDDAGQVSRRRGRTLKLAGVMHSLRTVGGRTLLVKDGELGQLYPDYSFAALGVTVGSEKLSYTQVDATTYFSSRVVSGKLLGDVATPWGAPADAGEWVSPVQTPTDTLGEVFGHRIVAPPMAQEIEAYSGRIYLGAGKYLWATELWMYDYIDKTKNFLQFESDITMIAAMSDGLYIGCHDGLYFLKGTLSEGFVQNKLQDGAVARGSLVYAPATEVHPAAQQSPMAEAVAGICVTEAGICGLFDSGQVINLTRGRVVFPAAADAAALYRFDLGGSSYVSALDSGGTPTANVRIGDFVDAEIVRRRG